MKERDNLNNMCFFFEKEQQKKYDEFKKLRALIGEPEDDLVSDDEDDYKNDAADEKKKYQGEMEVELEFLEN